MSDILTRYGIDTSGAEGKISQLTQLMEESATAAEKSQKETAQMYRQAASGAGAYEQAAKRIRAEINAQV